MEIINMDELVIGDVYTEEIKLHRREAFHVIGEEIISQERKYIIVASSNDLNNKTIRKKITEKQVIKLRHE